MAMKVQVVVITVAFLASVGAVGALALFLVDNLKEDSLEEKDLRLAAELLCPNAPEDVQDDLFFDRDSDDVAYIGVTDADEPVSFHLIASETDSGERVLAPVGEAALAYMRSMSLSCFAVESTPPPPTDTP